MPRALASIPTGSGTLVIDAQSSDETVAIAAAFGARVIVRRWEGFVATRIFALSEVQTPYTLMLDADESLDPVLRDAILEADPQSDGVEGYEMHRVTWFAGRPISGAGWGDERVLRLFPTHCARLVAQPAAGGDAELHERWRVDGTTRVLAGTLRHDSYPTIASYREKFDRYTTIEAAGLVSSRMQLVRVAGRAFARAIWLAIGRRGFADGWRGLYVAWWSAWYPVVVHWKALRRRS